jgi:imidazolonepropionase-like amidohydrolase
LNDSHAGQEMKQNMSGCLVIEASGYFDADLQSIVRGKQIAVKDGKISAIGASTSIEEAVRELDCTRLSLPGLVIMPGLINTHVHLEFSAGEDPLHDYLQDSQELRLLRALKHAEQLLASGVTTARDCGSSWAALHLGNPRLGEVARLPRLLMCGPPLTVTGGHLHFMDGEADTREEIVKGVRLRRKKGARSIKIMATGGQMTPGSYPEQVSYEVEEIAAAVKEARAYNLPTVAHCLTGKGLRNAVLAEVDSVEHCAFFVRGSHGWLERIYEEDVAQAGGGRDQLFMNGLSAGYHRLDGQRRGTRAATAFEAFALEQEKRMFEIFGRLVDSGFVPVVGTDAGVTLTPFDETCFEMELMERAGLSRAAAIKAGTIDAARALGLASLTGSIQVGKLADLVGIGGDPLQDIRALRDVRWVMREGIVVRPAAGPENGPRPHHCGGVE